MDRREFLKFLLLTGSITFLGFDSGCGKSSQRSEELKRKLKIPPDAEKVLVMSQSSHWDINWQMTFEEYYKTLVERIISNSLFHLKYDKDNTYSISEIAFLKRYLEDHPEELKEIQKFFREDRLQIVGGGFTSPDTILPTTEMLIRDWMYGGNWTYKQLGAFPDAAWQPDSFGHSGTLPDILSHLGYRYVGFSRIDGAPFYTSSELKELMGKIGGTNRYIPGSHGEYFWKHNLSLFWWEGPGGGRVLAYWMPYTYCQGDYIDSPVPASVPGFILSSTNQDKILDRIEGVVNDLDKFSKGRKYLFVPVGCDFQDPHFQLAEYARWWNSKRFKDTGVYVVTATFRDFMVLSEAEEKEIPVFRADFNPLWTGFYTTHPILKEASTVITRNLIQAEELNILLYTQSGKNRQKEIENLWEKGVLINHHDWIPGTSLPHVYYDEQLPESVSWMAQSSGLWGQIMGEFINSSGDTPSLVFQNPFPYPVTYHGAIEVELDPGYGKLSFETDKGSGKLFPLSFYDDGSVKRGQIVSRIILPPGGVLIQPLAERDLSSKEFVVLADFGNYLEVRTGYIDLMRIDKSTGVITELNILGSRYINGGEGLKVITYRDKGGIYRMGMELSQNGYREILFSSAKSDFEIIDQQPLRWGYSFREEFENFYVEKKAWIYPDSPEILFEVEIQPRGVFPDHISWVTVFETTLSGNDFISHLPGGTWQRKRRGIYQPTYWPVEGWLKVGGLDGSEAIFASPGNRAWRVDEDGRIEVVILRNTYIEEGANLGAWCDEKYGYKSKILFYPGSNIGAENMIEKGFLFEYEPLSSFMNLSSSGEKTLFSINRRDILIQSFYKSSFHDGYVIRLYNPLHLKGVKVDVSTSLEGSFKIYRINGREEKLADLGNSNGKFTVEINKTFETYLLEET